MVGVALGAEMACGPVALSVTSEMYKKQTSVQGDVDTGARNNSGTRKYQVIKKMWTKQEAGVERLPSKATCLSLN